MGLMLRGGTKQFVGALPDYHYRPGDYGVSNVNRALLYAFSNFEELATPYMGLPVA